MRDLVTVEKDHATMRRIAVRETLNAWLAATILSGIPSTLYALMSGADPLEATRAAAAMLPGTRSSMLQVLSAAAVVHGAVSLLWTVVLVALLPRRRPLTEAVLASAVIALLDLRVVAPLLFPEVAALAFWPQFADHLMWGACVGMVLRMQRSGVISRGSRGSLRRRRP